MKMMKCSHLKLYNYVKPTKLNASMSQQPCSSLSQQYVVINCVACNTESSHTKAEVLDASLFRCVSFKTSSDGTLYKKIHWHLFKYPDQSCIPALDTLVLTRSSTRLPLTEGSGLTRSLCSPCPPPH